MSFCIFIWNFKIGGVQKHAVLLANYLVKNGWQVSIIYKSKEGDLLSFLDERVVLTNYQIPNTNNPLMLSRVSKELKKIIPIGAIVLSNGPNNFRQLSRINFLSKNWKLLYILQNDLEFKKNLKNTFNEKEISLLANSRNSKIVALSKTQKNDHEKRLKLKSVNVIPNFIDFNHSYVSQLNQEKPKGVSIGRYAQQKGYDILLDSMKMVTQDKRVSIYGFGEEERLKLIERAQAEKISNIEFHQSITNVYEVLSRYDYFVLSSRFEPFGIVVAEALSCGLPVLTTDCNGPLDIITEANGIIVKKNDSESLARGIDEMVEKIKQGYYNAEKIRKSAEKYSVEKVAEQYLDLFVE